MEKGVGTETEGLPADRATVLLPEVEAGLRDRWAVIQSTFDSDSRGGIQAADELVQDISAALVVGIEEHRSRLAANWLEGRPEPDELRSALQAYRAFISILLPG